MQELSISGLWLVEPEIHSDDRGIFCESFVSSTFNEYVGRTFATSQVNTSISHKGAVRGIHYAQLPPSQAKYITCTHGKIWDVVVDIREGSPTFGSYEEIVLDAGKCMSLYVAEGLGHLFVSLEDDSRVMYLTSTTYNPQNEYGINPYDTDIAIDFDKHLHNFGITQEDHILSTKDAHAPSLRDLRRSQLLPQYEDCEQWYYREKSARK